jgi:PHP family Zn ribbon phosphoesterase
MGRLSYDTFNEILQTKDTRRFLFTIEVDPSYGKYHFDGHRTCGISLSPAESKKHRGLCPKCGGPLTIGVLNRVEELADREEGVVPPNAIPFKSLLPLSEILGAYLGVGQLHSKKVWETYTKLIKVFGSELTVLLESSAEAIGDVVGEKIADAVVRCREGAVKFTPGFDGVYGRPLFEEADRFQPVSETESELKAKDRQKTLTDF